MNTWFKQQGSKLILSTITSMMLICPTVGYSEEVVDEEPSAFAMFGDAVFIRPLLAVATVVGAGVFVVTLPFSAAGGNVSESADVLVGTPGDALLFRCLGCSEQENLARKTQAAEAEQEQSAVNATAEAAEQESKTAAK